MEPEKFECVKCEKTFTLKRNYKQHIRRLHPLEYAAEKKISEPLYKCLEGNGCEAKFHKSSLFIEHLESVHNLTIDRCEWEFENYQEFQIWLEDLQKCEKVRYFRTRGKKIWRNLYETMYLYCSRTGQPRLLPESERKRNMKSQGTRKIGSGCTSHIILKRVIATNHYQITYVSTHYGHLNEAQHLFPARGIRCDEPMNEEAEKVIDHQNRTPNKISGKSVKYPRRCSVPHCSATKVDNISLHYFPKDPKLLEIWQTRFQIGFTVGKHMQACNRHFAAEDFYPGNPTKKRYLKRQAVPTQNLPDSVCLADNELMVSPSYETKEELMSEFPNYTNEEEAVEVLYENGEEIDSQTFELNESSHSTYKDREPEHMFYESEEEKLELLESNEQLICQEGESLDVLSDTHIEYSHIVHQEEVLYEQQQETHDEELLPSKNEEMEIYTTHEEISDNKSFTLPHVLDSDDSLMIFTGINLKVMEIISQCALNTMELNSYIWTNVKERIILVLCKLRRNISFECLAVLFQISPNECTSIFYTTLSVLSTALKPAIYWPSKNEILEKMPAVFDNFLNTRVVLNSIEIQVPDLECDKCNSRSYSKAKQTNTIKYLLGSTPAGRISFVSSGFGGGVSEKAIFLYEGILEKVEPGEAIMVNLDFQIEEECSEKGVSLIVFPNFGQINEKLMCFEILQKQFDRLLIPYADEIMTVVASVVNLSAETNRLT